jgi:signal transduction histidine kinase
VTLFAQRHEEAEDVGEIVIVKRELRSPGEDVGVWLHQEKLERVVLEGHATAAVIPCDPGEGLATPGPPQGSEDDETVETRVIRLADVIAESDPSQGLVLRIPTRAGGEGGENEWEPSARGFSYSWVSASGDEEPPAGAEASGPPTFQEFRLPIPTTEYQALFSSLKKGSLVLFFSVLLVGTALSAGLAARFTRPIRRLDAGIRRLSGGDLDVVVDVTGPAEVGRVGRAFNDMAHGLRAARERERELVRREKLSSLGRLAAGVAHDVRNPLHSIGLTLQNIQESGRPEDADRARDFDRSVGVIREEIGRLDRLVTQFLQFARSDRHPRESLDLAALLRETARLVEHEAERRGVALEVSVEGDVPPVLAEAAAIRSSVLNLVLNSFEAMPEGGRVDLRLRREGDELLVEVADTGPGIPEADRERVFEFAYTTRDGGHGLGLPMVHKVVVEDHQGRITVDSRDGEGTRIVLALPLTAPAESPDGDGEAA